MSGSRSFGAQGQRDSGLDRKCVEGTPHAEATAVEDVGVDHRRGNTSMAKQFLDSANIVASFEQVRGKRVAKRMTGHALPYFGAVTGIGHRSLHGTLVEVVPHPSVRLTVAIRPRCRK